MRKAILNIRRKEASLVFAKEHVPWKKTQRRIIFIDEIRRICLLEIDFFKDCNFSQFNFQDFKLLFKTKKESIFSKFQTVLS